VDLLKQYYGHLGRLGREVLGRAEAVDWLLGSEARGSGRTLLMALTFVRRAALSSGTWIKVWDHHDPDRSGKRLMLETIRSLFTGDLEIGESAIMARSGWPRGLYTAKLASPATLHGILLEDVETAVRAALDLGVNPEELDGVFRETLVKYVMEA
jgi:hypothetical protein